MNNYPRDRTIEFNHKKEEISNIPKRVKGVKATINTRYRDYFVTKFNRSKNRNLCKFLIQKNVLYK